MGANLELMCQRLDHVMARKLELSLLCIFSVLLRISPPELARTSPYEANSPMSYLRFAPPVVQFGTQDLVWSVWNSGRRLSSARHVSYYTACLLLLSGNIEVNPGPKHPCGFCSRSVRSNQRGILCEVCYFWYHTKCIDMPVSEYNRLSLCDEAWCCSSCLKAALPFSDCSLNSSSISVSPPSPVPLQASPHPVYTKPASFPLLKLVYANC